MDNTSANPIIVFLLCVARCLVPMLILLGVSYLLRRFGFIKAPPLPPDENNEVGENHSLGEGGLAHENKA
jgi:hypothetical protein